MLSLMHHDDITLPYEFSIIFLLATVIGIAMVLPLILMPYCSITPGGLKFNPMMFAPFLRWEGIKSIGFVTPPVLGKGLRKLVIRRNDGKGMRDQVAIMPSQIEKFDEFYETLRIYASSTFTDDSQIKSNHAEIISRMNHPRPLRPVQHQGYTFTPQGISFTGSQVPWKNITRVSYPPGMISGYGAIDITYRDSIGMPTSIKLKSQSSFAHRASGLYLAHYASGAEIDKDLVHMVNTSPKDAKTGMHAVILALLGLSLIPAYPIMYSKFGLHEADYGIAFKIMGASLLFIITSIVFVSLKSQGRRIKTSIMMQTSILALVTSVAATASIFIITPASLDILTGHYYLYKENTKMARHSFYAALNKAPESKDTLYEVARLEFKEGNWEAAFTNMQKAYEKDTKYWWPPALKILPLSLIELNRAEEATRWCQRIQADLKKNHMSRRSMKPYCKNLPAKQ